MPMTDAMRERKRQEREQRRQERDAERMRGPEMRGSRDMDRELRGRRGDDILSMTEEMQTNGISANVTPPVLPELALTTGTEEPSRQRRRRYGQELD